MFKRISIATAQEMLQSAATVADIRDPAAFANGHIAGAVNLNNENLADFIATAPTDIPLLVFCYHGNSSQPAAQYLAEQGFQEVYSVDGGMAAWQLQYPVSSD
ncbi:MAG: thiosulfate sulfurtransferase GlpE [Gammaproteobacteria bacterium]|nr:thiosulfate sulfurtransferase GlpE [Gammaproteobacteria bacterium]NVK89287.1 thiosulfate sulfurtransferase GlpE [Gammaproteobacteria bacterium]